MRDSASQEKIMAGKQVKLNVGYIFRGAGEKGTDLKFAAGQTYDEETLKKAGISSKDYQDIEPKK
jgi:hypothetical protein